MVPWTRRDAARHARAGFDRLWNQPARTVRFLDEQDVIGSVAPGSPPPVSSKSSIEQSVDVTAADVHIPVDHQQRPAGRVGGRVRGIGAQDDRAERPTLTIEPASLVRLLSQAPPDDRVAAETFAAFVDQFPATVRPRSPAALAGSTATRAPQEPGSLPVELAWRWWGRRSSIRQRFAVPLPFLANPERSASGHER